MNKTNAYKQTKNLSERREEGSRFLKKYKVKVPVIAILDKELNIPKNYYKFIVSGEVTVSELYSIIRKRIKVSESKAIFCLTEDNSLLMGSNSINDVYRNHKDEEDQMMYIYVTVENVFG